ncbi:MAG: alpha/beta hydrolase [Myxococcota bacterium]|nr:alpha/beta hydrolase [Myxococcota bacterium]
MSESPFDPEYRSVARFLPRGIARSWSLPLIRLLDVLVGLRSDPENVDIEETGAGPVRVHRPTAAGGDRLPAVMWFHGGGFLIGTPKQDDVLCRRIADELGAIVVAPEYRLAPEHPFPAALDDAYAALRWLAKRDEVDESRIAVAGASAGGGLAAQVALHARDRGEVRLAAQILVYPMLDDRTVLRTDLDESGHRLWDNRSNRIGWSSYLGHQAGAVAASRIAVPSRNEDLRGLPPAWIGVGALDLFYDENMAYADRLRAADVACETITIDGVFHGFDGIVQDSSATKRFRESMFEAMRKALGPTS